MIFRKRSKRPNILKKYGTVWRKRLLNAKTKAERKLAENKYRHAKIRQALEELFHKKCAYCESAVTHVSYAQIEHFRPKNGPAGKPSLAFAWSNLLLACGVCNGPEFKGVKFPSSSQGGPLVDPCRDNPADHFSFDYDPKTKLATVTPLTTRGRTTERILGLNRPDLRTYRSHQVTRIACLAKLATTDPEAASLLNESRKPTAPYSAFAMQL